MMHSDAWTKVDRAVNLYNQNERFLDYFAAEELKCANGVERKRVTKMLRGMADDFAGYQRETLCSIIDRLEAWGDGNDVE